MLWVVTRMGEPLPEWRLIDEAAGEASPEVLPQRALGNSGLLTREGDALCLPRAGRGAGGGVDGAAPGGARAEDRREVWKDGGAWYGLAFEMRLAAREPGSRDAAVEMGRRGIHYLVRARAFERPGGVREPDGRQHSLIRRCSVT